MPTCEAIVAACLPHRHLAGRLRLKRCCCVPPWWGGSL